MTTTITGGHIQTVLGPISPASIGPTLMHEHLVVDLSARLDHVSVTDVGIDTSLAGTPPGASESSNIEMPLTLENRDWVLRHTLNRDNLRLNDEQAASEELFEFAYEGGSTVVDSTSLGLGRDPLALARISRRTGVNVVMGSGYYTDAFHPPEVRHLSVAEVADSICREFSNGVGNSGIKPGLIGEVGLSWPVTDTESTVLSAAVAAQRETGACLQVHPGRAKEAYFETIERVSAAGGDLQRTVLCHVDRGFLDGTDLKRLARTGVTLEFDLFGQETSFYALGNVTRPNDAQRIQWIRELVDADLGGQVVVSQDICMKVYLKRGGGPGYAHLLRNVFPMMRERGISAQAIHRLSVQNPTLLLTMQEN